MNRTPRKGKLMACGLVWLFIACSQGGAAWSLNDQYRIHDAGQPRDFEIALDELQPGGPARRRLKFPALRSAQEVRDQAKELQSATGGEFHLVLYERGVARDEFTRRILTRSALARLDPSADPKRLAEAVGGIRPRSLAGSPGWWIFDAIGPEGALSLAERLRHLPGVARAEAQLARWKQRKLVPDDTFFPQQWHLLNTGQNGGTPGVDINVAGVWDRWRGNGMVIGIVDDGIQGNHPDLTANFNSSLSTNLNNNGFDLSYDTHGTPVAGIAAARGNNGFGVSGVAFEASLADLRLLGDWDTDEQDRAAVLHRNDAIHVKNNSWGASDGSGNLEGPGPLMADGLIQGTTLGRGGQGEIYVFAGGNGRAYREDVNYDGFANAIQVIAVGAVSDQGQQASYGEPGACLAVVAPSRGGSGCSGRPGITTTDLSGSYGNNPGPTCETALWDFTQTFGGTSAATPIVSGIAALVLQANPNLGWRDVKEILMRSATKVSPYDPDWSTNAAGLAHNHRFGAGLVNAGRAVSLATNWLNLGSLVTLSLLRTNLNLPVPDNAPTGVSLVFPVTNAGFRVDHAALTVTLPHARFGDLAITLVSPAGTVSRLAEVHSSTGQGYNGWTLTSVRHWGEQAQGNWTVRIADLASYHTGVLSSLRLDLSGSEPQASLSANHGGDDIAWVLRVAAPGWNYALQGSPDLENWSETVSLPVGLDGEARFVLTNSPVSPQFYRARLLR